MVSTATASQMAGRLVCLSVSGSTDALKERKRLQAPAFLGYLSRNLVHRMKIFGYW